MPMHTHAVQVLPLQHCWALPPRWHAAVGLWSFAGEMPQDLHRPGGAASWSSVVCLERQLEQQRERSLHSSDFGCGCLLDCLQLSQVGREPFEGRCSGYFARRGLYGCVQCYPNLRMPEDRKMFFLPGRHSATALGSATSDCPGLETGLPQTPEKYHHCQHRLDKPAAP
mmetsp:Transcript_73959/g.130647  ORF Transcript_73959/g.130647 Transcript_73959/m.130647 type:complete len:169 (+) Transcript_73959:127-633(+)